MRSLFLAVAVLALASACDAPPGPEEPATEEAAPLPFLDQSATLQVTTFAAQLDECSFYGTGNPVGQLVELQVNEDLEMRGYSMLAKRPLFLSTLQTGTHGADGRVEFGNAITFVAATGCAVSVEERAIAWREGAAIHLKLELSAIAEGTCGALPIPVPCTSTAEATLTQL